MVMSARPHGWRVYQGGRPQRYRRPDRTVRRLPEFVPVDRFRLKAYGVIAAFCLMGAGTLYYEFSTHKWDFWTTLRHAAAAPNCAAARRVGLAPARRGQPGYYLHHNRDQDGIACEPWRGY